MKFYLGVVNTTMFIRKHLKPFSAAAKFSTQFAKTTFFTKIKEISKKTTTERFAQIAIG